MKWAIKAAILRTLGWMPARVADPLYHGLQQRLRQIPVETESQLHFASEVESRIRSIRGKSLEGLRVVELGSGWYPLLPLLLLRKFGVHSVDTFDINRHYSADRIKTAATEIMRSFAELSSDPILKQTAASGRLPEAVKYHPRTAIQHWASVTGGPMDLAVSRSVVEYIPPEEIRGIHSSSRRWLKDDAVWVHLIGTSDDRARQDSDLHRFDFLRYSEREWLRICGNRYAYKNRLRLPQYRALFESAGWHVDREQAVVSNDAVASLNKVLIHPDFRGFLPEELVAGSILFALVRDRPAKPGAATPVESPAT